MGRRNKRKLRKTSISYLVLVDGDTEREYLYTLRNEKKIIIDLEPKFDKKSPKEIKKILREEYRNYGELLPIKIGSFCR
ncbi:MAG: hypothetical protein DSY60_02160, partial [Persephonella sp.]